MRSIKEVKKRNSCTLCVFAVLIMLALVFPLRVRAGVIDDDDRVLVDYAHSGPFRSIVALDVTRGDGRSGIVSGFMVDEFHVVTAAHNVWFPEGLRSAEAIPGLNGTDEPFGRATVTKVRLFPSWATGNGIDGGDDDIALLTLDRNVGFFTGWMTLHTAPSWDSIYYQVPTYVAGYPDKVRDEWVKGYMYFDGDSGGGADEHIHWYYMDTSMGMSGSPVWIEELLPPPTRYLVLSVHTDTDNGKNHGTRISQDKLDQLNDWMSQDTPPTDYADLTHVVEYAGFTPNSVVRSQTEFSVEYRLRNVGTAPSGGFWVYIVLTTDDPFDIQTFGIRPKFTWKLASQHVPSLDPFAEHHFSWSDTFPLYAWRLDDSYSKIPLTGPGGGYYVYLMIDFFNEVVEFNEDDNIQPIQRWDRSGGRVAVLEAYPIASIEQDSYRGTVGFPVILDGSASYDPDGDITSYNWDFGDGSTYSTPTFAWAQHTYAQEGTYTVTLTVKDDEVFPRVGQDDALVTIGDALPWSYEIVDPNPDVGWSPSIALDSNGRPHISYYDIETHVLRYARLTDKGWVVGKVPDPLTVVTAVDQYTSIALDSNDNPHISYQYWVGPEMAYLKYAWYQDFTTWVIETVDTQNAGYYSSIALDSSDLPHIAYSDRAYIIEPIEPNGDPAALDGDLYTWDLKYVVRTLAGWTAPAIVDEVDVVCSDCSLALDSLGRPHISYRDETNNKLKYATWDFTGWAVSTVPDPADDVGKHTSIALDSDDNIHIIYFDGTNLALKYAVWQGDWFIETVDLCGDIASHEEPLVSMALDSNGDPHVSYFDITSGSLKYAWRDGNIPPPAPSAWSVWVVEWTDSNRFQSSIAVDFENNPHIAYKLTTHLGGLRYAFLPPSVVVDVAASDPSGFFTVTIDAGADKGVPVTSWTEVSTTNIASYTVTLTDGDMVMVIEGQLLDPSLEGQIVLEVDPVGKIITYEINIAPYEAPTIVPEFGLSAAIMMSLAAMIYLTLKKRMRKNPG